MNDLNRMAKLDLDNTRLRANIEAIHECASGIDTTSYITKGPEVIIRDLRKLRALIFNLHLDNGGN